MLHSDAHLYHGVTFIPFFTEKRRQTQELDIYGLVNLSISLLPHIKHENLLSYSNRLFHVDRIYIFQNSKVMPTLDTYMYIDSREY